MDGSIGILIKIPRPLEEMPTAGLAVKFFRLTGIHGGDINISNDDATTLITLSFPNTTTVPGEINSLLAQVKSEFGEPSVKLGVRRAGSTVSPRIAALG